MADYYYWKTEALREREHSTYLYALCGRMMGACLVRGEA